MAKPSAKTLVIAEKPSVARDIARVLGAKNRRGDWLENDGYVVSSALGHLVELAMPEDISPQLRRWTLDSLPILPEKFTLKVSERTKERFDALAKLLAADEIDEVINACDSGREGELIFSYIYELSGCAKPFKRLWMVSMTSAAIGEALANLRPAEEMVNLQAAARCRSEADWLVGINGTRAVTTRMFSSRNVASVGRVQTPTLAMVVERDRSIKNFISVPFWRIRGSFSIVAGAYEGLWRRPQEKGAEESGRDRIYGREEAERILEAICAEKNAVVSEKSKRQKQSSPRLYDLTSLQREANGRFGFSAATTLKIAQALYEAHKAITYPRTDAKVLPEDYESVCRQTLGAMDGGDYEKFARAVLDVHGVRSNDRKIFDNGKVSDHFAIIPTPQRPGTLSEAEWKIYDMVVRRFLAVFYPPAEYDVTVRSSEVGGHSFHSEGRVLAQAGWKEVYGKDVGDEGGLLAGLCGDDGDPATAKVVQIELVEEKTRPQPHHTEATLLSAMESAGKLVGDEELSDAMAEKGLGTPATRAQIIDTLVNAKYMEKVDRSLCATAKAEVLMDMLAAMDVRALRDPALTGEWEFKLRAMEQGKVRREEFMGEIASLTASIVEKVKGFDETDSKFCRTTAIISPSDGKPFLRTMRAYVSSDRAFTVSAVLGGREIGEEEVAALLRDGRIGPFEDFRSRNGKPFKASVVLDGGRAKLEFENGGEGAAERARQAIDSCGEAGGLCQCPARCGGKVYAAEAAYICDGVCEGRCGFRISRRMLGHAIVDGEILAMAESGKSPLIADFISNRTGKPFSAFLRVDSGGKISFEFPPREPKKAAGRDVPKGGAKAAKRNSVKKDAEKIS
ncbi:MAG: DNA topoisomerase 3 [Puniceicoccales bacterium]|jgi:DNA topoisomerase-3|nr:DNA topoisomerase 3 [Puniceicoccales bacterium]